MNWFAIQQATMRLLLWLMLLGTIGLSGCGGGGDSSTDGTAVNAGKATLTGTAATGAPLAGVVSVQDANGTEVSTPINADGTFTVQLDGTTPPYLLQATPANGDPALYSYAAAINTRANITPLTHLAVFIGNQRGDLDALYRDWSTSYSSLTGETLDQAQQLIRSNFQVQFTANGVDSASYDFMVTEFVTDGTGIDGVLDSLRISVDYTTGEVSVSDAMGNPLVFNLNTVSDGLAHIAGPDLRYRDGRINEYHAELVYEVLRVLFSFKPQQIDSGLLDLYESLGCSQGGSRQRIIQRPSADNNYAFLEQYDHQGCTGQLLPDPLGNIADLDAPTPRYDGQLATGGTYVDDLNQYGKTAAQGLSLNWESNPENGRRLSIEGQVNFTRTGVNAIRLEAPNLEPTNPTLSSVTRSDMFTQLGYGDYTETTHILNLRASYDGGDITGLTLELTSSNNNQPNGYVLEVTLDEPLVFVDPWQWQSGRLSIREGGNRVPGVSNLGEVRVNYVLDNGHARQYIEVDYNGDGVIDPNDPRDYLVNDLQP